MSAPIHPLLSIDCPYPGLRPFDSAESRLFFGRDRQVVTMLARLETQRFLAVVGVSGCGKSSLVCAGLIPAVRDGWLAHPTTDWRIATMRPGGDPFGRLANTLIRPEALGPERAGPANASAFLEATLRRGRLGLREAVNESGLPRGTGLMLVVDQFEEIFRFRTAETTTGHSRDDADAFVDLLLASTRTEDSARAETDEDRDTCAPAILVVITMRSDFLGDCAVFDGLPEAIDQAQFLTPRLGREGYEAAIREPARLLGGDLDPNLVARLLNDMGEGPDRLPVLQHALMRMWTRASAHPGWDRRLTLADYPEGGLDAALSDHCDEAYFELPEDQRDLAQVLFQALCERTGARRDTRRPQPLAEIAAVAGVAPDSLRPLIDAFRRPDRSFLAPPPHVPLEPRTVLDISHESLIRHWRRLARWVDIEQESANEYGRLADAARLFAAGSGGLLQGQNLMRLLAWKERQHPTSAWARRYGGGCRPAMAFLERSRRQAEAEAEEHQRTKAEQEAARQRELAAARALAEQKSKSARHLKIWLAISALLLVAAIGAAKWANDEARKAHVAERDAIAKEQAANRAEHQARKSEAKADSERHNAVESRAKLLMGVAERLRLSDPQLALLLALEANATARHLPQTETRLREVLAEFRGTPLIGHQGAVWGVAFAPDGRRLASGSLDGTVRIWDPLDRDAEPRVILRLKSPVIAVAYSPDGRSLAVGGADKRVRLLDLTRPGAEPLTLGSHEGWVEDIDFSPDGRTLASAADDKTVRLWDLTRPGAEPRTLIGHEDQVWDLAFSPDGHALATASLDGTLRLWDLKDPEAEARVFRGHSGSVQTVSFAPDGKTVASGGDDSTVRLWDTSSTGAALRVLKGHEKSVTALAFAPDGLTLASGSRDKTVRLWDLAGADAEPVVLRGHEQAIWCLDFAPDGRTLASASRDQTLRLWNLSKSETEPRVLRGHSAWVQTVAFTPDGRTLVSASNDRTVRLWDRLDPEAEPLSLMGHGDWVLHVAVSPDGHTLASASADRTVRLWDLSKPEAEPRVLQGHRGEVWSVSFAPNGRTLASGSGDRTVRLWDLVDPGAEPRVLTGHECSVRSVSFSVDGRTLAAACFEDRIQLWDLGEPGSTPVDLNGHEGPVESVLFSPDGRTLASASDDRTIRLWDLAHLDAQPLVLNGHEDWVWSLAFAPDGRTLASASADKTVRLWDLAHPEKPRVLGGHGGPVEAVEFSPDGQTLASASDDLTIRLWDIDLDGVRARACDRLSRNLSAEKWRSYFGDEPPSRTCPNRPLATSFGEGGDPSAPGDGARETAALVTLWQGLLGANKGDVKQVLRAYAEVIALEPGLGDDLEVQHGLCRYGGIWGQAPLVRPFCERAVELAPDDGERRDTRGMVLAQIGDFDRAIDDFEYFVQWAERAGSEAAKVRATQRRDWIATLRRHRSPFNASTLQGLR